MITNQTIFPCDDPRMYFFVREGYTKKGPLYVARHAEGYAETITFYSELLEGKVYMDGY